MKNDVVHSTERGAVVGLCAVVLLGFCTWEGGSLGIRKPNHNFARFEQALSDGKHVFFVDLDPHQEAVSEQVLKSHPQVELAGTGSSTPHRLIALQQKSGMIRQS